MQMAVVPVGLMDQGRSFSVIKLGVCMASRDFLSPAEEHSSYTIVCVCV